MRYSKLLATAGGIALLVGTSLGVAGTAFADDSTPTTPPTSQEAVPSPDTSTPPVTPTGPAAVDPGVVVTPPTPTTDLVTSGTPTSNVDPSPVIAPTPTVALVSAPSLQVVTPPATITVHWVLASGSTENAPFAGGAQIPYTGQCGTATIQNDIWKYDVGDHRTLADQIIASGSLDNYADSSIFISVTWTTETACPPPPPVQQQCSASNESYGAYYTEDTAPVEVVGGLEFTGTGNGPVDTYHAESVPLAGINGLGYTIASNTSGGADPAYVLEVYTTGTGGYTTLSWEPYQNGQSIDASGTFTGLESGNWWSSHIASGPGSQSSPISLAAFSTMYPTANIISHGVHLGSAESTTTAVVSSTEFLCGSTTFGLVKPTQPEPIVTNVPATTTDCTTNIDTTVTTTTTTPYVYDADSNTWVLGTPVITTATTTAPATVKECPPAVIVTPPATTPTATPTPLPVALSSNSTPTATETGNLPHTGSNLDYAPMTLGIAIAGGLLGLALLLIRRRRA